MIGQLLSRPSVIGEVVGTLLAPDHFYIAGNKILYEQVVEAYYADDPIDPITIAETCSKRLTRTWGIDEKTAVGRVQELAAGRSFAGSPRDHADVVKRHADLRSLLALRDAISRAVEEEDRTPAEIAGLASQTALQIASQTLRHHELVSYGDLGRRFIVRAQKLMAAREQGIELGAYFGIGAIDNYIKGLKATELMISAGPPGVGKSAVWWAAGKKFAERQVQKEHEQQIGCLVLSLEMGEEPSSDRLATELTEIDGGLIREGKLSVQDLNNIRREWAARKDLPLYFDFTSSMRGSQMRALIVEAIRKHNVGLVIIDHYRHWELDHRVSSTIEEDEQKAKFLKEQIAKDLNVAVIVIAHTTKAIDTADKRPTLAHLRGSGQIAAFADFVNFVHRPYLHATQQEIEKGEVHQYDAELIWEKNRHGLGGLAPFRFNASTMSVY